MHSRRKLFDRAAIALFGAAILAPAADQCLRPDSARDTRPELRNPAECPAPPQAFESFASWPAKYDAYFNDTFGLRDQLLRAHSLLVWRVFQASAAPTLVAGRDGWLFYAEEKSMETWRGLNPFTPTELHDWKMDLERRRDWLRARGIRYMYAVAPNKEAIYPDKLPSSMNRIQRPRFDQFLEYLKAESDVEIVDLRAAMSEERTHDDGDDWTYYPTGTHWTSRGAWAAWSEFARRLAVHFPDVKPLSRDDFEPREGRPEVGDSWAGQLYLARDFIQRVFAFVPRTEWATHWWEIDYEKTRMPRIEGGNPAGPRIMLLHDSFGPWMIPFAAESAAELSTYRNPVLDGADVEMVAPDVVIQLYSERQLVHPMWTFQARFEYTKSTRFAQFTPIGVPVDVTSASSLTAYKDAAVEARTEESVPYLAIEFPTERAGVITPSLDPAPGKRVALHVQLSSPIANVLNVWYQSVRDPRWNRERSLRIVVRKGWNDLYVMFNGAGADEIAGPLMIRPSLLPASIALYGLEARSFDP